MKVAIYSHSISPSIDGVCRRFTAILHELERTKHETLLFTMEDTPQDLPNSTKVFTLDHMIFPSYPNKKVAWPTSAAFYTIWTTILREKPDVIHIVSDGFSQMFTLVGLLLGVPVVGSFHTDIIDLLSTHNAYSIQKFLVIIKEAVDSIVLDSCATTSQSFSKKLAKQGVHCEHVIITAVDMKNFCKERRNEKLRLEMTFGDKDAFLCIYAGRISNEKRLDIVIDALKGLSGARKAYLAIVGDGPSASFYAKMHGKQNRIYCIPRMLSHKDLAEVYASSDVHVSASEFETLGNTVLEAFACAIPVVVPRTQGFRDTVRHNVDGFLFNPSDRDDARRCLQCLKDDVELQKEMGRQGCLAMNSRTIEYVVKDLLGWYAKGQVNRQQRRGIVSLVLSIVALILTVPLAILLFFIYNLLVKVILKPFIKYSAYEVTNSSNTNTNNCHKEE